MFAFTPNDMPLGLDHLAIIALTELAHPEVGTFVYAVTHEDAAGFQAELLDVATGGFAGGAVWFDFVQDPAGGWTASSPDGRAFTWVQIGIWRR